MSREICSSPVAGAAAGANEGGGVCELTDVATSAAAEIKEAN
jgi:hypothetical protein